jgi:hypothetical protein
VVYGTPDDPRFVRKDKAATMGLQQFCIAAIHLPDDDLAGKGIGTLSVYSFSNRPGALPSRKVMRWLARLIGRMVDSYLDQRERVAAAYLYHQLYAKPRRSDLDLETIQDKLMWIFEADGLSIFPRLPGESELACVTTTGLELSASRGPLAFSLDVPSRAHATRVAYDPYTDVSFTTYLAHHPGLVFRKNDVPSDLEKGLPHDLPPGTVDKYREKIARCDTDHRRFLGGSVGQPDDTLGVFRIVRSADSKPFTQGDELLLSRLAKVSWNAFLDWRVRQARAADSPAAALVRPVNQPSTAAGVSASGPPVKERRLAAAICRLLHPVPSWGQPQTLIGELLQDLGVIYQKEGCKVRHAGLLVRHKHANKNPFRLYSYHSEHYRTPPEDDQTVSQYALGSDLSWEGLLRDRRCVTFNAPDGVKSGGVASGFRMPLTVWIGHHVMEGIFFVDFDDLFAWDTSDAELIFHAARRLAAIWGNTYSPGTRGYVINPDCFNWMDSKAALDRFISFPCQHLGLKWTQLLLREDDNARSVGRFGALEEEEDALRAWHVIGREEDEEVSLFGVKKRSDKQAWSIPLFLGPLAVGEFRVGCDDFSQRRSELIDTITGLWSRLTLGIEEFSEVRFTANAAEHPGIVVWDAKFSWPLSRIPEGRTAPAQGPSLITFLPN